MTMYIVRVASVMKQLRFVLCRHDLRFYKVNHLIWKFGCTTSISYKYENFKYNFDIWYFTFTTLWTYDFDNIKYKLRYIVDYLFATSRNFQTVSGVSRTASGQMRYGFRKMK